MLNTVFGAIKNGNVPTSISELFTARTSNYNLRADAILQLHGGGCADFTTGSIFLSR